MKITRIPRVRDQHKKRVAAYCRVSTTLEEQEESYEAQLDYYTRIIQAHEDWDFAGVYSDEKSGTKASNRPGFQRLIKDSLNGKVDYILVKSISRFSRNIVDCQKYANLLHGNGVDVHFDKENLDTADPSCTMMFSFLSAIAQDESRSISENVKWGYRERFKRGEYNLGNNRILGYDCVEGKLVPNQDADAVRMIFHMYLEGKSIEEIRRLLTDYGIRTKKGQPLSHNNILYILQNETYVGDKLLQKQPPKDFLTKKPDERTQYESHYLENDHEAIVSRDIWDAVQILVHQRKELTAAVGRIGGRTHFLYGKLFCGECGEPMTRRTLNGFKGEKHKVWTCRDRHQGRKGNGCKCRNVDENDLLAAISERMGQELTEANAVLLKRVFIEMEGISVEYVPMVAPEPSSCRAGQL